MRRTTRIAVAAVLLLTNASAGALTIEGTFVEIGTPSPLQSGGGVMTEIFEVAAGMWERAILDDLTVQINYFWLPLTTFLALSTGPSIAFDNSSTSWFVDPTPEDDAEWLSFLETTRNLGGVDGSMITGRTFQGATGSASGSFDMLSLMLHEIGHSLGFLEGPLFDAETADGDVDVTAPRPFSGAAIPTTAIGGGHINLPEALMYPFFNVGERSLLSEVDIVGIAQVSGFSELVLAPSRIPEPALAWLLVAGIVGVQTRRFRRRSGGKTSESRVSDNPEVNEAADAAGEACEALVG